LAGNDVDTRRRAAADFTRALCKQFEQQVVAIFRQYIAALLQASDWRQKEVSIYLVTALATKGATARYGVTETSDFVDVNDFYRTQIAPELVRPTPLHPMLTLHAAHDFDIKQICGDQVPGDVPLSAE